MLNKGQKLRRNVVEFLTLEDRIPQDHLLRKIDGAVFIDGTHIKASAHISKKIKQEVPAAAARYQKELLAESKTPISSLFPAAFRPHVSFMLCGLPGHFTYSSSLSPIFRITECSIPRRISGVYFMCIFLLKSDFTFQGFAAYFFAFVKPFCALSNLFPLCL